MTRDELDCALLAAHEAGDSGALVRLYTLAADQEETAGSIDAACFFLTQAFVFALESGHEEATALNMRLVAHGRAHLLQD
jgi:hypothetical protein